MLVPLESSGSVHDWVSLRQMLWYYSRALRSFLLFFSATIPVDGGSLVKAKL